jgi:uncharacterized protein (TIGR00730 family)
MTAEVRPQPSGGPVELSDEEEVRKVLSAAVLGLWSVVNELTRLRPTKRERYRVTIFGSARTVPGGPVYDEVKRVATALAEMGCDIVTGGGPGVMQAANEGATAVDGAAPERSVGIRVSLPFEQSSNAFVTQAYEHRTFFTRLHHFVLTSDAFVVAPGGIGTVLETLMIWQLLQVRHVQDAPLILVGKMWPGLIDWASEQMSSYDPPLANSQDFAIPICVPTADEAIEVLRTRRDEWAMRDR